MSDFTIYEKNSCSKCREMYDLLTERGVDFERVDYHVEGIDQATIRSLLAKAGIGPRDALRLREPLVAELGLLDGDGVGDDELIALMEHHPQLLQRPIVVRGDRAVLARPVERVLELLD
jgi:arsenate reductase